MTTPITLPETRAIRVDKPRLLDWGGPLTPPLGGAVQYLNRLGTRWAIDVTIPIQRSGSDARTWSAALAQAKINGAMIWLRQDGFNPGTPGAPLVNGAGQMGTTLVVDGFAAAYQAKAGQFFSIVTGGRRYVHMIAADTAANGSGQANLPIFPMLRVSPTDNAVCEFAKPYLQGSLAGNEVSWTRLPANFTDFGTITISEDE